MHSSFYREPVKEICRTIFYRDLRTGNLQNLTWHFFFQRPPWMNTVGWGCCCLASLGPLMILGWFWVLSTFPFRHFGILTAHCLGSSHFTGIITVSTSQTATYWHQSQLQLQGHGWTGWLVISCICTSRFLHKFMSPDYMYISIYFALVKFSHIFLLFFIPLIQPLRDPNVPWPSLSFRQFFAGHLRNEPRWCGDG